MRPDGFRWFHNHGFMLQKMTVVSILIFSSSFTDVAPVRLGNAKYSKNSGWGRSLMVLSFPVCFGSCLLLSLLQRACRCSLTKDDGVYRGSFGWRGPGAVLSCGHRSSTASLRISRWAKAGFWSSQPPTAIF
ncbi:unnamed protein product [Cuscuta epithymum]|uniref:Secreted protein n=1 Tax=Cuscuta epithymum TaxID=186058 RepID=A0AAV0CHU2_9ASTE|nr:unnamed protein product [Cuscuta epithymum]CAH9139449.1 unnamed protein product [Cuscuta epithymum]